MKCNDYHTTKHVGSKYCIKKVAKEENTIGTNIISIIKTEYSINIVI